MHYIFIYDCFDLLYLGFACFMLLIIRSIFVSEAK